MTIKVTHMDFYHKSSHIQVSGGHSYRRKALAHCQLCESEKIEFTCITNSSSTYVSRQTIANQMRWCTVWWLQGCFQLIMIMGHIPSQCYRILNSPLLKFISSKMRSQWLPLLPKILSACSLSTSMDEYEMQPLGLSSVQNSFHLLNQATLHQGSWCCFCSFLESWESSEVWTSIQNEEENH